jgi:uncharacterized membrane protein YfcA
LYLLRAIAPLYSISGFVVGLLVGMTGVGGGSLMTPLLILLFGIQPATAVGTDLLYASATKAGGTLIHGLNSTVDWRIVRQLALGSVPASVVALFFVGLLDIKGSAAQALITALLAGALFLTAMAMIARKKIANLYSTRVGTLNQRRTALLTVAVGAALGVLVSLTSVGAGALGVTALMLLYPQLPAARIVGSDIAHAVPLTLVAGLGHWMLGSVDWQIFASLLVGSLPGIALGSLFAVRIPDTALRFVLAAVLIVVATKLSIDLYPHSLVAIIKSNISP